VFVLRLLLNKNAEMGIGTLVIFIAMILVASIAAGVLIQTAVTLQGRALLAGTKSTVQVSTSLRTAFVYGMDGMSSSIDEFRQQVSLVAGSDPIKFDDATLTIDLLNDSVDLQYDYDETCIFNTGINLSGSWVGWDNSTAVGYGGFWINATNNTGSFAVRYVKTGKEFKKGYLSSGDLVELCYPAPRGIYEDEWIRINFIPKVGSIQTITTASPAIMKSSKIFIYP
jgi:flagellin-like protein